MATNVTYNGVNYTIPATGDSSWGDNVSNYLVSLATGSLTKAGGNFALTADANFGSNFGLISKYFTSRTANAASTGAVRLANADSISFRNSGNSADLALVPAADGILNYNSVALATISATQTLTNKTISGASNTFSNIGYSSLSLTGSIVNADISNSAAIAYSKLSLAGSVVNADINASAAIAYSKLALTGSIVNADVNASAAIAYSKLALTGAILNADLAGGIAYSKLSLTGAILNADLAGSIAYSKLNLTGAILNADLAGSIAYSKLNLTGAILNADLAGSIAYSKLSLTGAILNADLAGSIAASKLVGSDIATVGTVTTGTWSATTIAVNKGGTGTTSVTTAPAASSWAGWDANKNLSANSFLQGYTTTATAAGTTTLTVGSTEYQYFTGSTTQTVVLPVASTLALGQSFTIVNNSTSAVTVQSSGANTVATVNGSSSATFVCILTSGTTAASWSSTGSSASPLTTKGDVFTYSTTNARHAVPGDYGRMIPDSGATDGWRNATYSQLQQGRPGKNYIQYADFENNATTGWTATGCATVTNGLPVSVGSGAAAFSSSNGGQTKGANTSSPAIDSTSAIAGTYALKLATTGAGTIGDGYISSALPIDAADQAKVLAWKVYYKVASGTPVMSGTSANTYAVAIYDVANNAWLPITGGFNFVQSSGVGIAQGTVQTASNSTSLQIFVYSPVAPTGASSLLLDDFYLGPQALAFGPAMTDWNTNLSLTPNNFGTVTATNYETKWEGDTLKVRAFWKNGTAAGSVASLTLPAGVAIDYNKISTDASGYKVGQFIGMNNSTLTNLYGSNLEGDVFADGSDTGKIYFALGITSGAYTKQTASAISFNSQPVEVIFEIPVVGKSSSTAMSADTDTRVVALQANASSTAISGSAADVAWTTTVNDTHGAFDGTTYTVKVTGYYHINAKIRSAATYAAGNAGTIALQKNGSDISKQLVVAGSASVTTVMPQADWVGLCNAGDTIKVQYSDNGTSPAINASSVYNTFGIFRLSGPAVVAATESVNGRYFSSTTAVTSSDTTMTYATKDFDSHNAYASGTLTIPVSGKYQFNAGLSIQGTFTVNQEGDLSIYKNGVAVTEGSSYAGGSQAQVMPQVSDAVSCLAGDLITIRARSNATSPSILTGNLRNWFSWARVGN